VTAISHTTHPLNGPRRISTLVVLVLAAIFAFAGFVSLGIWQVHRLAWKQALIAQVDAHVHAEPVPPPSPNEWARLRREHDEYLRLQLRGRFDHKRTTLVETVTELGPGYWVMTPLRSDAGYWVWINRGFVPTEAQERLPMGAASATSPDNQPLVGLLRFSEPGGRVLRPNDPQHGRWYSRDVQAMASMRGLADLPVAPFFVDLSATDATRQAWPRPGLTVLQFSNNHLVYALTWFALAAMTAGALGYLVVDERRLRRLAGDKPGDDKPPRH
jgi:surfeit locus 1 family protein